MEPKDQSYYLRLIDREFPESYLQGLKDGQGYELVEGYAAIAARMSLSIHRLWLASLAARAPVGALATAPLRLSRPTAAAGALTVLSSSVAVDPLTGVAFKLAEDVAFGGADLGPFLVDGVALARTYQADPPGETTTAGGEAVAGGISVWRHLRTDPPFADPTIVVEQVSDASGGASPDLEALGEDRSIVRRAGEAEEAYRARVMNLPDTVSPAALRRLFDRVFAPYGGGVSYLESFEHQLSECYDGPAADVGDYLTDRFAYDEETVVGYSAIPFRSRYLDDIEERALFIAVVPNLAAIEDVGMAYDDTITDTADCASPHGQGRRAFSAYDVPTDAIASLLPGAYDGFDLPKQATYRSAWEQAQAVKGHGITVALELEGQ